MNLLLTPIFFILRIAFSPAEAPQPAFEQRKPLLAAVRARNAPLALYLIQHGANLKEEDDFGYTPLICATTNDCPEIVKYLIAAQADPNAICHRCWTPLMHAARFGRLEIGRMLIDNHANINFQSPCGDTALSIAAKDFRPLFCSLIIDGLLQHQRERIYALLICLKRMCNDQYSNLRQVFKPILQKTIQEVKNQINADINRCEHWHNRNASLLEKYSFLKIEALTKEKP